MKLGKYKTITVLVQLCECEMLLICGKIFARKKDDERQGDPTSFIISTNKIYSVGSNGQYNPPGIMFEN
jgi:hypothetical protein